MDKLCDGRYDCEDGEDEKECGALSEDEEDWITQEASVDSPSEGMMMMMMAVMMVVMTQLCVEKSLFLLILVNINAQSVNKLHNRYL